jgi:cell division protein ZapA
MSDSQNTVTVTLLGKSFKVKCPADKVNELREAAEFLDEKVREVSQSSKINHVERVVVIVALNIVHELLGQKRRNNQYIDAMSKRIQDLQSKIDAVLVDQ